jgi:O-antigen/teichoic acid export membrane protein
MREEHAVIPATETTHAAGGTAHRSQAVLLAGTLAVLVLSLVITVLLGRSLSPVDYGFFALISTALALGRDVMDLGMGNVAAREAAVAPARERTILEGLLGWRAAVGGVLALICVAMAHAQGDPGQRWVFYAAALVISFMYLNGVLPAFQVRQAWAAPTLVALGSQILLLAGCVALLVLRAAGPLFALLVVLREAIVIIGNKTLAARVLGFTPRPRLLGREVWLFFGKILTLGLAVLLYNAYMRGGMFLVWLLRPEDEAGAFAAAFRPVHPLLSLPWVLMVPLVPHLARLATTNRPQFARLTVGTLNLAAGIGAVGGIAGWMLAPELIELLYGGKYSAGQLSAVSAFQWFSLAFCFAWITPVFATALLADGREKSLLALSATAFAVSAAANLLLLPRFPFVVAAGAAAVTEIIFCLGAFILLKSRLRALAPGLPLLACLLPAALLVLVFQFLPPAPMVRVVLASLLSALAVLALLCSPTAAQYRREVTPAAP